MRFARENVIDLFAYRMIVGLSADSRRDSGFSKTLVANPRFPYERNSRIVEPSFVTKESSCECGLISIVRPEREDF